MDTELCRAPFLVESSSDTSADWNAKPILARRGYSCSQFPYLVGVQALYHASLHDEMMHAWFEHL